MGGIISNALYYDDNSITYNNTSKNPRFDENSPPQTDLVKTRTNLIK